MEILLRRHDKTNVDPEKDFWCLKSGDVVVIRPDGWNWGLRELDNPDWRIVRITNLTPELALELEQWDWTGKTEGLEVKPTKFRKYALDANSSVFNQTFLNFWNDDSRSTPILNINVPTNRLADIRKLRGT